MIEFRRQLQNDNEIRALERFEQRCGRFGEREQRRMALRVEEVRDSGDKDAAFTTKGLGIVYNRKSLDLGGFQEIISPDALEGVLGRELDVHLLWDHSTLHVLARTLSRKYPLELTNTEDGVHFWARVAPTSFAKDLRVLMDGGVIDQASFAFTVAEDGWEIRTIDGVDVVIRTIYRIDNLFDITITAQGAYPQTDSNVVRAYALHYAEGTGRLALDERGAENEDVAPTAPQAETPEDPNVGDPVEPVAPSAGGDSEPNPAFQAAMWRMREQIALHRKHI